MKKIPLLNITAVLVIFITNSLYAQSSVLSKELTWQSSELTDKSNSQKMTRQHTLVTNGNKSIELRRGEEQTLTFEILAVKGDWSDEKVDGSLEYEVISSNGVLGRVTLTRKGAAIKAWLDFTQSNKNGLNVEFIVNSIQQRL